MGKLSVGAEILKVGGMKKVFKHLFSVRKGEKMLKASQCYLSTTSGPLAGLFFISTDKVSFCSERSIKVFSSKGHMCRVRYKVVFIFKHLIKNLYISLYLSFHNIIFIIFIILLLDVTFFISKKQYIYIYIYI